MKIELHKIKIKDLVEGYSDTSNEADGCVVGYGGKLDIRPKYQREAVIDTILKGFPLNTMYWVKNGVTLSLENLKRDISSHIQTLKN